MAEYHVIDEAILDATPEEVTLALADEAMGRSDWWGPRLLMRARGGSEPDEVGAVVDYRVSHFGRADRPGALTFSTRVVESAPGRLVTEYIDGVFRGRAVLTMESVEGGRTSIREDWQTSTHGLFVGILARLFDIGAEHSRTMQQGYANMQRYIAARRAESPSRPG